MIKNHIRLYRQTFIFTRFNCQYRFIHRLKVKVKNKEMVEGSICNAYLVEEASTFFSYYFEDYVQTVYTLSARNEDVATTLAKDAQLLSICVPRERSLSKPQTHFMMFAKFKSATNYFLLNCEEVQQYINHFANVLCSRVPQITDVEVEKMIEDEFPGWFKYYVSCFPQCK
jgi:hypothetical protein